MTAVWYCLTVVVIAALPVSRVFAWFYAYISRVASGLEGRRDRVLFSWAPVLSLLATFLTILKGFFGLALTRFFFEEPFFLMAAAILVVLGHYASIKINFSGRSDVALVIFGALLFLHWGLAVVALLAFVVVTVIADDLRLGSVAAGLGTVWASWRFEWEAALPVLLLMGAVLLMMLLDGQFESPLRVGKQLRRLPQSPWL